MAKRRYLKGAYKRISGMKRSFYKSRGGYKDKLMSGYNSSLQQRITRISNNALRSRVSAINVAHRKSRMLAKDVNLKLKTLQKWGRYDTWASKNLISRLESNKLNILDRNGLINIDKVNDLNFTQLATLNKAMDQFVNSKTKTIQGINAVVKKKKQILIEKSNNPGWVKSLSNKEVEDLYRIFDDEEFNTLSEKVKYEQIWNVVVEANEKNLTEEDFISELELYLDEQYLNDDDVMDTMSIIYNRYVNYKEGE